MESDLSNNTWNTSTFSDLYDEYGRLLAVPFTYISTLPAIALDGMLT